MIHRISLRLGVWSERAKEAVRVRPESEPCRSSPRRAGDCGRCSEVAGSAPRVVPERPELKTIQHASHIGRGFSRPENASGALFQGQNASALDPGLEAPQV